MKAITTLLFIILIGFTANAQEASKEVKVAIVTYGVELNVTIEKAAAQDNQVARLYMDKNYRVKKALSFKTKRNKAKMA